MRRLFYLACLVGVFAAAVYLAELIYPGARGTDNTNRPPGFNVLVTVILIAIVAAAIWGIYALAPYVK